MSVTEYLRTDFPEVAIQDCSTGKADADVAYWVDELNFRPDPEATRACLRECGAWDDLELSDDEQNRHRLFWIMMCDFAEWDELPPEESNCGSEVFWLGA